MWRPWGSMQPIFNKFDRPLEILQESSQYGFQHFSDVVNEQKKSLQPFNHSYTVSNKPTSVIDIISQSHLRQCNLSHLGEPYEVTGNGSCLFNAVSFALCGSEDLSTELRYRTCIEMVSRKDFYTSLPIAKNIIWVSPNYITSTFECASKHGWSSMWTLLALAQVICIPIKSVYPPLNGENDLSFKTLNLTAIPRNCLDESVYVTVMWTRASCHNPKQIWTPNHFVPLIVHKAPNINVSTNISTVHSPKSHDQTNELMSDTEQCNNTDETKEVASTSTSEVNTLNSSFSSEHDTESTMAPSTYQLPNNQNLNATQLLSIMLDQQLVVVDSIPTGFKDNVYCVLDNTSNMSRRQSSKYSNFTDDCGAWDTHSGRTNKTDFIIQSGNILKWTTKKDGVFCYEKKNKGKKTLIPYNPQPDNVVTLNRYYTSLKRDKSYKKRVSWFTNLPDTLSDLSNTAVAEYSDVAPRQGVPHGNAQHSSQEYVRTDPNVIDKVKEGLSHKQSCSEIYKNMVLDNPESAPRDHHQIRNLAYNQKKQHKSAPLGNIADEIVHIFSLVNNSDFVKEVVYTEGNNKPPSIICYTKDMMKDMTQFLKSDNDRILGVDRTFNLGAVFVTNFVYKNTKVIRKETGEHPIFIGPIFLHWEGSYLNYHTFFSHVKARIQESIKIIDLRIGSDDESGLTKALDDVFPYPGTTRMLCTKHMKDNVSDHLKNKVGCNDKDRLEIIDNIFGSTGLVTTDDSVEFDLKSNEIAEKYPQFATYFKAHLKDRLFDHVSVPMKQLKNQDRLWTNNNCESINHVFKKSINWKPQSLQDLVTNLHDITRVHFADLKRALYGTGNYELFGNYTSHKVSLQCWLSKTPEQKDRLFLKLVNDCKTANSARVVRAVNTNFETPLPQRLAKKPNQNKRPRLCRTKPRY